MKTLILSLFVKHLYAILNLTINYGKPIGNGIITALNKKQAYERCGKIKSNKPNKGYEAAKAGLSILKMDQKKFKNSTPRIKIIQKIYNLLSGPMQILNILKINIKNLSKTYFEH